MNTPFTYEMILLRRQELIDEADRERLARRVRRARLTTRSDNR